MNFLLYVRSDDGLLMDLINFAENNDLIFESIKYLI